MKAENKKAAGKGGKRELAESEKDKETAMLKARLEETQAELYVSNAALDVMQKKFEGADKILSKTGTRATIADALKERHPLPRATQKL